MYTAFWGLHNKSHEVSFNTTVSDDTSISRKQKNNQTIKLRKPKYAWQISRPQSLEEEKKKKRLHFLNFKHKHGLKKVIDRFENRTVGIDRQHLGDAKTALNLHLSQCSVTKKERTSYRYTHIHIHFLQNIFLFVLFFMHHFFCCVRYVLLQPDDRTKIVVVFWQILQT